MDADVAVVIHNVLPMLSAPASGSEQVSQAILGDIVHVLETRNGYARIQTEDSYQGWVLERHLMNSGRPADAGGLYRIADAFAVLRGADGQIITRLVYGSPVRLEAEPDTNEARVQVAVASGAVGSMERSALEPNNKRYSRRVADAPDIARLFTGSPYLWGGTTPFGFDCSGLVQRVYLAVGITLPRDAYQQAQSPLGAPVPDEQPLEAGDLVFFRGAQDPRNRGITHVGLMLDASTMIHASGKTGVIVQALSDAEISREYKYCGSWRYGRSEGLSSPTGGPWRSVIHYD